MKCPKKLYARVKYWHGARNATLVSRLFLNPGLRGLCVLLYETIPAATEIFALAWAAQQLPIYLKLAFSCSLVMLLLFGHVKSVCCVIFQGARSRCVVLLIKLVVTSRCAIAASGTRNFEWLESCRSVLWPWFSIMIGQSTRWNTVSACYWVIYIESRRR